MSTDTAFSPYEQNITIFGPDGEQYNSTIAAFDELANYELQQMVYYGIQIGMVIITFLVVLLATGKEKWKTLVFIMNMICLALTFISRILLIQFFLSKWVSLYTVTTLDYEFIPKTDIHTSVVGSAVPVLLTLAINISLALQANQLLQKFNVRKLYYWLVMGLSILVLCNSIAFRTYEAYLNIYSIVNDAQLPTWQGFITGALFSEMFTIWWFFVLFTGKLVGGLLNRRTLKLKRWSVLHILTVGGFCTMFIPGIFALMDVINPAGFTSSGSFALALVVVFLPLTSLWAGASNVAPGRSPNLKDQFFGGVPSTDRTSCSQCCKLASHSTALSTRDDLESGRRGSEAPMISTRVTPMARRDSTALALMQMGIRVDRSTSVYSERKM